MLSAPVGRNFAVAPAVGAGLLLLGGGLLWLTTTLDKARERSEAWYNTNRQMDSLNRKVNLRTLSDDQLQYVQRQMQNQQQEYIRDPLTGVTVTQPELNTEFLRRSGQGGFLFVPPVVAAPAAAKLAGDLVVAAAVGSGLLMGLFAVIPDILASLWGLLNGPEKSSGTPTPGITPGTITGTVSPTGSNLVSVTGNFTALEQSQITNGVCTPYFSPINDIGVATNGGIVSVAVNVKNPGTGGKCGGGSSVDISMYKANGSLAYTIGASGGTNILGWTGFEGSISISSTAADAVPVESYLGISVQPWPGAALNPLPALPAYTPPAPSIAPAISPTEPATQPQTEPSVVPSEPGPTRPAVPAVAPSRPPTIAPWLLPGAMPGAQQIAPNGQVAPLPLPLPAPTPAGSIFPVAGGQPITANGPPATITGIATEVGRLEQKLDRMLNPGPGGDGTDRLQLLQSLLTPLVDAILSSGEGGKYELKGPCEIDENGDPKQVIKEVQYLGALTSTGVLSNKLDALAKLLQEHKNLRQPTCRQKPPTGEFVTVNFEQID